MIPELREKIEEFQKQMFPKIPTEIVGPLMKGIEELVGMGLDRDALRVGASAPDFELPNAVGAPVVLSRELARGPAVVTFYRGGW